MATREELLNEAIWRKCKGKGPTDYKACQYFLKNYFFIKHPSKGRIKFELRKAQEEALKECLTNRYVIVLKARQIGWSTLMAGMCFWEVFFYEDKNIVMLSKGEREAIELLSKAKFGYKLLPQWMKDRGPKQAGNPNGHQQRMMFENESGIKSLPSNQDPARGESVWRVVVDEWAFLNNPAEAWASIEPITDVAGSVTGLSTANGSGNFFHDFWVRAVTGTSGFKWLFYPWNANTDRDQAWYEVKKRNMPPWQLHQEYPGENWEEAFIKSGNPVFDTDQLTEMPTYDPVIGYLDSEPLLRNNQEHDGFLNQGDRTPIFLQNVEGSFHRWQQPVLSHKYVIGCDVAEGLEYGDFSVATVIDIDEGLVVAKWRAHIHAEDFAREIYRMGYYYNKAFVGVETNNHGLTTITALNRWNYPNLYYRHSYDERTMRKTPKLGWYTSAKTKPLMIDELATAIRPNQDGEAALRLWDNETIGELKTFIRDPNGKMRGSPFDDQVIALAIANQMLKHSWTQTPEKDLTVRENTFEWWLNTIKTVEESNWVIGGNSGRR